MARHTPFGKEVKKALIDLERTGAWLAAQIRERTGLHCDDAYLSNILSGRIRNDRVELEIRRVLDLYSSQ